MGTNYDARAEELVLNMLHIHGHQFAMRATSSTNPDAYYIFALEQQDEFKGLPVSVKSQIKRALNLKREFLQSGLNAAST